MLTEQDAQLTACIKSHQNPPSLSSIPSVRLARACDEWEQQVNAVEKGLEGTIPKVDAGLTVLEQQQLPPLQHKQNGSAHVGLITLPSPHSLSSDSNSSGGKS